jgi:phage terminase large subunit
MTEVFSWILEDAKARIQIHQGGTSSSKTYSILQYLYLLCLKSDKPLLISVVGETMPAIRRGALRDFINIVGSNYNPSNHNKTECTFKIHKSMVEFFSADQPDKLRGARRDILYINECNNVSKEIFNQLEVRTKRKIFLDYNPSSEFWAHELKAERPEECSFRISTYLQNTYLDAEVKRSIEARRHDANWWKVFGLGQVGELEGRIMPMFDLVKTMPKGMPTTCGMDFGYTNDPSVLLEQGIFDGALYINQLFYARGMTNQDIVKEMRRLNVPRDYTIYADCAEPKSIREIYIGGFTGVKPCVKGDDCFKLGVDHIRRYKKIYVTENSIDIIKDYRNAMWDKDIDGKATNKAKKGFLHGIDALIYSMTGDITPLSRVVGGNKAF